METTSNSVRENELQYREAFELVDLDKDGKICQDELMSALKSLGLEISPQIINEFFEENSGQINLDGFYNLLEKKTVDNLTEEEKEVINAFKTFDKNGNGTISSSEFKYILCNLGDKLSESEVDEIFKEADLNHDGVLNYVEFVKFWSSK